jgi:DNA repair photolyase
VIHKIKSKSVLNKHKMRDSWFLEDYTLNPYFGWSFNCVYCYVLPENLDSAQRMGAIITFSFSTMDWKWPEYLNLLPRRP